MVTRTATGAGRWVLILGILAAVSPLAGAQTPDEAVADGVAWLKSAQKADGSWGGGSGASPVQFDTSLAILALEAAGETGSTEFAAAVSFISGVTDNINDFLSRKIVAMSAGGLNVGTLASTLTAQRQTGGDFGPGWGYGPRPNTTGKTYQSSVFETALALQALVRSQQVPSDITSLLSYLIARQRAGGGWSHAGNIDGDILTTSVVLETLQLFRAQYVLEDVIFKGGEFLKRIQNADGGWGTGSSNTFESAVALYSLFRISDPPTNTGGAVDYLIGARNANGSWSNHAADTAYAIRALLNAKADLAVRGTEIRFAPTDPTSGDLVTISAIVRNAGGVTVGAFDVAFYDGNPDAGGTLIGAPQNVAGLAAGATTLVTAILDTTGIGGNRNIYVIADAGNAVSEVDEQNNRGFATLFVTAETDLVVTSGDITFNPVLPIEGDLVTIIARIRNDGRAAQNVGVRLYVGNPAAGGQMLAEGVFPNIPDGQSVTLQVPITGIPEGRYDIYVVVDPDNTVEERDETNNTAFNVLVVAGARDLYVNNADFSVTPIAPIIGQVLNLSATVHNGGQSDVTNLLVQFYRGHPEAGGVQIGQSVTIPRISGKGTGTASTTWDPRGLIGSVELYVKADANNQVSEVDEENNIARTVVRIAGQVDLAVTSSDIQFDLAAPVAGATVTITATVRNTGISSATNVVVGFFDGPPSSGTPVWPVQTEGVIWSSPALADLNGDTKLDVVFGSSDFKLHVVSSDGNPFPGWPIMLDDFITGSPAIADIDGDEELEIIIGGGDGKIHVFNLDGSEVAGWPVETGNRIFSSPAVADLDGDGSLEIVVGSRDGLVYALNAAGTPLPGWPRATNSWVDSSPALGDLTLDGNLDIVVGSYDRRIYAWSMDGQLLPGFPVLTGDFIASSPVLGDIDGDGRLEIIIGSDDGNVYALNSDGTPVPGWPRTTGDHVVSPPALADIDGDGNLEVVIASQDKSLYVFKGNGANVTGFPLALPAEPVAQPSIADIDNDGRPEIVLGLLDGRVYAWNHDGTPVGGVFPYVTGGPVRSTAALCDLDGDGAVEVVVGSNDGRMHVINLPDGSYNPFGMDWPYYRLNSQHTANVEDAVGETGSSGQPIGQPQTIALVPGVGLAQAQVAWDTTGRAGDHSIYVVADLPNEIVELDESNNMASRRISVLVQDAAQLIVTRDDLRVTPANPRPTANNPVTVRISADVRNAGTLPAADTVVNFYDGNPASPAAILIGSVTQTFAAGSLQTISVDWVVTTAMNGRHTIFVVVDPENLIPEPNERDNSASRAIFVGNRAPELRWAQYNSNNQLDPYRYDGVNPDVGDNNTVFTFRVLYFDDDGDFPAPGYPRVEIDINGDGDIFDESGGFREGAFTMVEVDPNDRRVDDGKLYEYRTTLPFGTEIRYAFKAVDSAGTAATEWQQTIWQQRGPTVIRSSVRVNVMPEYTSWVGRGPITLYGNVHWSPSADTGSYRWEFGDGSPPVFGIVQDPEYIAVDHDYRQIGEYTATLTVIDARGNSDSDTVVIHITEDDIATRRRAAILDGLRFLYQRFDRTNQRWRSADGGGIATTGMVLLAFADNDFLPEDDYDDSIFAEYLAQGYKYLYTRAERFNLTNYPVEDMDSDGMGFRYTSSGQQYTTGMALMGLSGNRETTLYAPLMRDIVDYLLYARSSRGGWRYGERGDVDNSVAQWPALGLYGAQQCPFYIEVPEWVWAFESPDNPYGVGLLNWLDSSQSAANGGLGYTGPSPTDTMTAAGAIMYFVAGEPLEAVSDRYVWNVLDIPEGTYYIYVVIDDGVNPPKMVYAPGRVTVAGKNPELTILDPSSRTGGWDADSGYFVTWRDNYTEGDARIDLYYDRNNTGFQGDEGLIVSGLSEDDTDDYYLWDTRNVPPGSYYVLGRISADGGQTWVESYSAGVVNVQHDSVPAVWMIAPNTTGFRNHELANQIPLQYVAQDIDGPTVTLALYFDNDDRNFNGTLIAEGLPIGGTEVRTYLWDTTDVSAGNYYIYAIVNDGVNPFRGDYTSGVVTINHPPVLDITGPVGDVTVTNDLIRVSFNGRDGESTTSVSLFYDTDTSGADGTLIVSGQAQGPRSYDWDTRNVPAGDYYLYGVMDDGVNAPTIAYATPVIRIPAHAPKIVSMPGMTADEIVDSVVWLYWQDWDLDSDAEIEIYLDPNTQPLNGNEVFLVGGISEDDETDSYLADISSVTPGNYYVYMRISDNAADATPVWVGSYSSRRLLIQRNAEPDFVFRESGPLTYRFPTAVTPAYDIPFVVGGFVGPATVALYLDNNRTGYDGTLLVDGLPVTPGAPTTYNWVLPTDLDGTYYIHGTVFAGTLTHRIYSPAAYIIDQPPTISIYAPAVIRAATSESTHTLRWRDFNPNSNANIDLYFDMDDSGLDGTLIVRGLSEDANGTDGIYNWDVTDVTPGEYFIYAIIDDGANPAVIDYSTGTVVVSPHIPRVTILDPLDVPVDQYVVISWTDRKQDSDADINFFFDPDTSPTNGNEIVASSGVVKLWDDQDYLIVDTRNLREGRYYVNWAASSDGFATVHRGRTNNQFTVDHVGAPQVVVLNPPAAGEVVSGTTHTIRFAAIDLDDDAVVSLYYDTDRTPSSGLQLITDGLIDGDGAVASYVWSVTALTSRDYYIYARVDDGRNAVNYHYSNGALTLDRLPVFAFTSPASLGMPADQLFNITWTRSDAEVTTARRGRISLYYDTDDTGADGTLIVKDLPIQAGPTSHQWDTSRLAGGEYYLYAVVDDQVNAPIIVYSSGTVAVTDDHAPTITVFTPEVNGQVADRFFVVQWSAFDFETDGTIDLYLDKDSTTWNGDELPLLSGLSEDADQDYATVDIASVTPGRYYVLGVITGGTETAFDHSPAYFDIAHGTTTEGIPFISVVRPKAGNVNVTGATPLVVEVVAFDFDNPGSTTFNLYYSTSSSGLQGLPIAENLPIVNNGGLHTIPWDVSNVASGTYYVYASIFDGVNNPVSRYSLGTYTINRAPDVQVEFPAEDVVVSDGAVIRWADDDPDTNATISIYYDETGEGFDGKLIVAGLREDDNKGPYAAHKWVEERYNSIFNSPFWIRDFYFTYGWTKYMRLYEIARMASRDWEADLVDYMSTNQFADGSWNGGSWATGSGDDRYTMHTAWGVLSITQAVLGTKPVANAGPDRIVGVGDEFVLDGRNSFHPNKRRTIVKYEWDLNNDGSYDVEGATATHRINQPGTFDVVLRVTDDDLCTPLTDTDVMSVRVTTGNRPPVAVITAPSEGFIGFEVTFDGSNSNDPDIGDSISRYEWDLNGDGLYDDAQGPVATAVFNRAQIANVGLRVTDSNAADPLTGTTRIRIEIVPADLDLVALGDSPDPFSPGSSPGRKDTSQISFEISKRAAAKAHIFGPTGALERIIGPAVFETGGRTFTWNGRNDSGDVLDSELYTYKLGGQNAVLYPGLGYSLEPGVRLDIGGANDPTFVQDPVIVRNPDLSFTMYYAGDAGILRAESADGETWTRDPAVLIPAGGNTLSEPELVRFGEVLQNSWTAGQGVAFASETYMDFRSGALRLSAAGANLAGASRYVYSPNPTSSNDSVPSKLIDGALPSNTDARDAAWVGWTNQNPTITFDMAKTENIDTIRVYAKTDTTDAQQTNYPNFISIYSSTDNVNFVFERTFDFRGEAQGDTAKWLVMSVTSPITTRKLQLRFTRGVASYLRIGEVEILRSGFAEAGELYSSVQDLGDVGLLTFRWSGSEPIFTSLAVEVRAGDTPTPDGTWSAWTTAPRFFHVPAPLQKRYAQYRVRMSTTDPTVSPQVSAIRMNGFDRMYYTSTPPAGSASIKSAITVDGDNYIVEAGDRILPGAAGALDDAGASAPSVLEFGGQSVRDWSTGIGFAYSSINGLFLHPETGGLVLAATRASVNILAASEGTSVLMDFQAYPQVQFSATQMIEGDRAANRANRWAGADNQASYTVDFDLGQDREVSYVRMFRHDNSFEVQRYAIYGASILPGTTTDLAGWTKLYQSALFTSARDDEGMMLPRNIRYLRFFVDRWFNSHPEVAELEIYEASYAAREGVLVSTVIDLLGSGLTSVNWEAVTPGGTEAYVEVRSGDTPLVGAEWTDWLRVPAQGSVPAGLHGSYIQYRIVLRSDGVNTPVFNEIRINRVFRILYTGNDGSARRILTATSRDGLNWAKDDTPVIDLGGLTAQGAFSGDASRTPHGDYALHFVGQAGGVTRLLEARSEDGINWSISGEPDFEPTGPIVSFPSVGFLALLDGTSRLYFTGQDAGGTRRIYSAAAAPEGQIEIDNIDPTAVIASPLGGATLEGLVRIRGTATDLNYLGTDANYVEYRVELSSDGQNYNLLTRGVRPVVNGDLYTWDTVAGADGAYRIRLTVDDLAGNRTQVETPVTVDNGGPPRPIITEPTVHGIPVAVGNTPTTVSGFSDANTDVEVFLELNDGTRSAVGTVRTQGGNTRAQTYADTNYSGGSGVAYATGRNIAVNTAGHVQLASSTWNIAHEASVVANSFAAGEGASRTNDLIWNNYYTTASGDTSAMVTLTFPTVREIDGVRIRWRNTAVSGNYDLTTVAPGGTVILSSGNVFTGIQTYRFAPVLTDNLTLELRGLNRQASFHEIEVFERRYDPLNVAAAANGGQMIRWTSQFNATSWAAQNLIDGSYGGGSAWASVGNQTTNQELVIAFDREYLIDNLVIYNFGDGTADRYSRAFNLALSTVGDVSASYATILSATLGAWEGPQSFSFPETPARYAKITVLNNYGGLYAELTEIEIHTADAQGILISTPKGAGDIDNFNTAQWFAATDADTAVDLEIRTGNTLPVADSAYTPFRSQGNNEAIPDELNARHIQYRATLRSDDFFKTPVLTEVRITSSGEYGNWSIPGVPIGSGTNTISAFAIDSDNRRSEESLPIEVTLEVVQLDIDVNKTLYAHDEDVRIDLGMRAAAGGFIGAVRDFIATVNIVDVSGNVVNRKPTGERTWDVLQSPFWVEDVFPTGATPTGNFEFSSARVFSGNRSWVGTDPATGTVSFGFTSADAPLRILRNTRLVQYVYLDPTTPPREILIQFEINETDNAHAIFYGTDLIDIGVAGTPSRFRGGLLPETGGWRKLVINPADVGIPVGSLLTGVTWHAYQGVAYWDRLALGLYEFDVSLGPGDVRDFDFVWNTEGTSDGFYQAECVLQLGDIARAETDRSRIFEITPDLRVETNIWTDKAAYRPNETARLTWPVRSLSRNHRYQNVLVEATVDPIDGATSPLFVNRILMQRLSPGERQQFSGFYNVGISEPGSYPASVRVLDASENLLAQASTNFDVLADLVLEGTITASPEVVVIGVDDIHLDYAATNRSNFDIVDGTFLVQFVEQATDNLFRAFTHQASLARGDTFSASQTFPSTGLRPGTYVAILSAYGVADVTAAIPLALALDVGAMEEPAETPTPTATPTPAPTSTPTPTPTATPTPTDTPTPTATPTDTPTPTATPTPTPTPELAFLVLDGLGEVFSYGGALTYSAGPIYPATATDRAIDIASVIESATHYLMTGFGSLFTEGPGAIGGRPLTAADYTGLPFYGWNIGRDLETVPGSEGRSFYFLDGSGIVYALGQPAPPDYDSPFFYEVLFLPGHVLLIPQDRARDLELVLTPKQNGGDRAPVKPELEPMSVSENGGGYDVLGYYVLDVDGRVYGFPAGMPDFGALPPGSGPAKALEIAPDFTGCYVLTASGTIWWLAAGQAPTVFATPIPGDPAPDAPFVYEDFELLPDGSGGYILDGQGHITSFGDPLPGDLDPGAGIPVLSVGSPWHYADMEQVAGDGVNGVIISSLPTPVPTPQPSPTAEPTPVPSATPAPTVEPTPVPSATPVPTLLPTEIPAEVFGTGGSD